MLIAFTGKRGHGKSTAAGFLEKGEGFAHLNFADPLREVASIVYGLSHDEMVDTELKEQPLSRWPYKTPREILQYVGTEMFRAYISDTWTTNFQMRAAQYDHVTNSDTRFLNEEAKIREMGGVIVRIIDPRKIDEDTASKHSSETEMDQIEADYTIINDGSLNELASKVMDVYQQIVRGQGWAEAGL